MRQHLAPGRGKRLARLLHDLVGRNIQHRDGAWRPKSGFGSNQMRSAELLIRDPQPNARTPPAVAHVGRDVPLMQARLGRPADAPAQSQLPWRVWWVLRLQAVVPWTMQSSKAIWRAPSAKS